jgi:hypothetical protein
MRADVTSMSAEMFDKTLLTIRLTRVLSARANSSLPYRKKITSAPVSTVTFADGHQFIAARLSVGQLQQLLVRSS